MRRIASDPRLPFVLLALAMVAGAITLLWVTRGITFIGDEWGFYAQYPGSHLHDMLEPRGGHLVIVAVLLYKGMLELFGPSSVAFRLLFVALVLISAGLLFELLRRRVGPWLALGPAVVFLVLGQAGTVIATTLGIQVMLPIATGLGALLLVERRGWIGDLGTFLLLIVGIATYGQELPFLIGVAIAVMIAGGDRWRRCWIFLVPLAIYVVWRLWAGPGHPTGANVTLTAVLALPSAMLESASAGLTTLAGLPLEWGEALVVLALGTGILLYHLRRGRPFSPWIWIAAAMLFVYWALVGAVASPGRPPLTERYQTVSVVLLLFLFAELGAGLRASPRVTAAVLALFGVFAFSNFGELRSAGQILRANSDEDRGMLAAVDLERDRVSPDFLIEYYLLECCNRPSNSLVELFIYAGEYFSAADRYGSPAYSLNELEAAPAHVRDAADFELVRLLGISPQVAEGPVPIRGELESGASTAVRSTREGPCVRILPLDGTSQANFILSPGGFSVRPDPGPASTLQLARFGPGFAGPVSAPIPEFIGSPAAPPVYPPIPGQTSLVRIPTDPSPVPWRVRVTPKTTVTVCPLPPG